MPLRSNFRFWWPIDEEISTVAVQSEFDTSKSQLEVERQPRLPASSMTFAVPSELPASAPGPDDLVIWVGMLTHFSAVVRERQVVAVMKSFS